MIRQHCTLQDSYCHEARRLDEEFLKASFRSEFIIPRGKAWPESKVTFTN